MIRLVKQLGTAALKTIGYKPVQVGRTVIPLEWTEVPGDRFATRHRPAYVDCSDFLNAIDHLEVHQAFQSVASDQYPLWRLHVLWSAVRSLRHVEGDLVEFGSFRGGCAYTMMKSMSTNHEGLRRCFLFDTFSGIPAEGLLDSERDSGFAGRFSDTSIERVLSLNEEFRDRIIIRQGLVPQSLQTGIQPDQIALAHVDLNAAEATRDALEWLDPRWSIGGMCIFDDYLWAGYEQQTKYIRDFTSARGLEIIALPTGQGIVINTQGPLGSR